MSATPTGEASEPTSPQYSANALNGEHVVLEYLRSRGFTKTEQLLREEMGQSGANGVDGSSMSARGLSKLLASVDAKAAEEVLSLDPADKAEGFRDLETWVDGSLDMYRVCIPFCIPFPNHLRVLLARI